MRWMLGGAAWKVVVVVAAAQALALGCANRDAELTSSSEQALEGAPVALPLAARCEACAGIPDGSVAATPKDCTDP